MYKTLSLLCLFKSKRNPFLSSSPFSRKYCFIFHRCFYFKERHDTRFNNGFINTKISRNISIVSVSGEYCEPFWKVKNENRTVASYYTSSYPTKPQSISEHENEVYNYTTPAMQQYGEIEV